MMPRWPGHKEDRSGRCEKRDSLKSPVKQTSEVIREGEECNLFLLMACVVSVNGECILLWELSMGVRGCD